MRRFIFILFFCSVFIGAKQNVDAQMLVERLDRGAIAIKKGDGYYVTWRLLGDEDYDTGFNIYRGSNKLNDEPITTVTSYYDSVASSNSRYYVKAIVDGEEVDNTDFARIINNTQGDNAGYFDISLNRPSAGSLGGTYSPNDASAGDLNGDGEYDIVLKWNPSNAKDNSQSGKTDDVYLDGYTLDGEQLWRIDLGPNIRAGAHYTQFLVYDFDGNGKAEIMCKTAPGTIDGTGNYISKGPAADADHSEIYRNSSGYILSGPEYLTVFDGETGEELATANYWPQRGTVSDWGDSYGNRVDRFNAAVAYVDGERPSAVFQRGYYTRLTMAAWNWRDGELTRVWTFDSDTTGNSSYYGQGNHYLGVIDANGDGLQDLVTGSAVISGTGEGLETSGQGHGDACHATFMQKSDSIPMIFMCHECSPYGMSLRYANSSDLLWRHTDDDDTGRGCAAELDPEVPGFKFWAVSANGLCDIDGNTVGSYPSSVNFVIWWNGELSRELMNSNTIQKWSINNNSATTLLTGENTESNNGTKATPCLQADLFGDWREEVILRTSNNEALRVFTTTMTTEYRLYTFMHDPTYRAAISWQQSSYNQPPHPGFYVASDMDFPPPTPNIKLLPGYYRGSGEIIKNLMVDDLQNAADWEIADSLGEKISIYGNKTIYANDLPESLIGKEFIKTSTSSNTWIEGDTLASFEVTQDAIISVFINKDITERPDWLSNFDLTDTEITVSSAISSAKTMALYEKKVSEGEKVYLGPNSNDGDSDYRMYFVVARGTGQSSVSHLASAKEYSLQVYPNPFNTVANVKYYINKSQVVTVGIYDFNGKLIRLIDKGFKGEGYNSTTVDCSSLPSGVYLIRLLTADNALQQKIVVAK